MRARERRRWFPSEPPGFSRGEVQGAKLCAWLRLRDWADAEKWLHQNQHKLEQALRSFLAAVGFLALGVAVLILAAFLLPIVL